MNETRAQFHPKREAIQSGQKPTLAHTHPHRPPPPKPPHEELPNHPTTTRSQGSCSRGIVAPPSRCYSRHVHTSVRTMLHSKTDSLTRAAHGRRRWRKAWLPAVVGAGIALFVGLPDEPHVANRRLLHPVDGAARAETLEGAKLHVRPHVGAVQIGLEVGVGFVCQVINARAMSQGDGVHVWPNATATHTYAWQCGARGRP
jgi:hypothetical protein